MRIYGQLQSYILLYTLQQFMSLYLTFHGQMQGFCAYLCTAAVIYTAVHITAIYVAISNISWADAGFLCVSNNDYNQIYIAVHITVIYVQISYISWSVQGYHFV